MAKKSSKQQSKSANTANPSNTVTVTVPTLATPATEDIASVTTSVPPSAPPPAPASVSSPSPRKLEPITDTTSIEWLVGLAKDSPPDSALGIVWRHTYEEGYENGQKSLLQNLEKKLKEKFEEGQKEGIEKSKEKYYGKGIVKGEYEEHKRWKAAGHGERCFRPIAILDNAGTQTDPTATTTTISIQTNPTATSSTPYTTSGTQTKTRVSPIASSQSPALFENRKNAKIVTTSDNCCEISPYSTFFSSSTSSVTSPNSTALPTTITALETRSTAAGSTQKVEKVEKLSVSTQTTPQTPVSSIVGPVNDVARAHKSIQTPKDIILQPPTSPTTASSSPNQATPYPSGHEKSAFLRAAFEPKPPTESPVSTTIVPALKTHSETAEFTENHQKVEKAPIFTQNTPETLYLGDLKSEFDADSSPAPSTIITDLETRSTTAIFTQNHQQLEKSPVFTQNTPEPLVSTRFKWADDADLLPALPTIVTTLERCGSVRLLTMFVVRLHNTDNHNQ
jgi:hypothetical protein